MVEFLSILMGVMVSALLANHGVQNATLLAFAALIVTYLILLYVESKNSDEDYFEPKPWNRLNFVVFIGISILCYDWLDFFFKGYLDLPLFILGMLSLSGAMMWGGISMGLVYATVFAIREEMKIRRNSKNQEVPDEWY